MKSQRRFAPKGDRNKPESVAGLTGISKIRTTDDIFQSTIKKIESSSCHYGVTSSTELS
ncbi:MAG: hypothetical protein V3R45_02230 [Candidatus Aminicenantaceae bacterium]